MTFILNIIPTIIFMVGAFITYYFFKIGKKNGILFTIVLTIFTLVAYQQLQPSYITKTSVKGLPSLPMEGVQDSKVEDRSLRPEMTTQERNSHFENNVLTYDEKINKILNNSEQ